MKTLLFTIWSLLVICVPTSGQTQADIAFTLQIGAVKDKLHAKGVFYQVASALTRQNARFRFVETETEALGFKQVLTISLSQASSGNSYLARVGLSEKDVVSMKADTETIEQAAQAISKILMRLNSATLPKTQINLCYQSEEVGYDNASFSSKLQNCLNESQEMQDRNISLKQNCQSSGSSQGKIKLTGSLLSKDGRTDYHVTHNLEGPDWSILLPTVQFPPEERNWNVQNVCSELRPHLKNLLSLSDELLKKLGQAQGQTSNNALSFVDQLLNQEKKEAALFLLSFLKEKEAPNRFELQKQNPILAEICIRSAQIYFTDYNDYGRAQADFQIAMKANHKNAKARIGYARTLASDGHLDEAKKVLLDGEKNFPNDPEYNIAIGDLYSELAVEDEQHYTTAIIYYEKAKPFKEYQVTACKNLAWIHHNQGRTQVAIRDLKIALNKDSSSVAAALAEIYYELGTEIEGDDGLALKYYDSAIHLNGANAEYYYAKAYAQMNLQKLDDAIKSYSRSIEHDPDNATRHFALGYAYHYNGEEKSAIKSYSKAIELDPDYAIALNNRSILFRLEKNYKSALVDINRSIELDPNSKMAYYNKGLILTDSGEYEMAITNYTESLRLDSVYASCIFRRGLTFYRAHDYDNSKKDFRKYVKLESPDQMDSAAFYYIGASEYQQANFEPAIQNLSTYISAEKNFYWSYYFRGNAYYSLSTKTSDNKKRKDFQEGAKHDYRMSIALDSTKLDAYFELAVLCSDIPDVTCAIEVTRTGIRQAEKSGRSKDLPELYGNLGWYLFEAGHLEEALKRSQDAIKINDKMLYVRFNLGLIALKMGDTRQARIYYDDAITNLISGKHQEPPDTEKYTILEDLALTDLKYLIENSEGSIHNEAIRMVGYLEGQKQRLTKSTSSEH